MAKDSSKIPVTPATPEAPAADPAALTVPQLARLLRLPEAAIREHVAEGAPTNPDGSINLVHYAAWLNAAPPPDIPARPGSE